MEFNRGQKIGILTMCLGLVLVFKCLVMGTEVMDLIFWFFSLGSVITVLSSIFASKFVENK